MADQAPTPVMTRGAAVSVALGSGFSGVSALVVQLLAARWLTKADNGEFLVFWSAVFACYAVLMGIQQEVVRGTATVVLDPSRARSRTMPVALGVGAVVAFGAGVTWPWWHEMVLPGRALVVAVVALVSLVAFSGHLAAQGALMGHRRWHIAAGLSAGEAAVRLVAVGVALLAAASVDMVEMAVVVSSAVWLVLLVWPAGRAAASARADVDARVLARQVAQASAATLGTAVLVVGFPTVMRVTVDAQTWKTSAPLVLAIMLTRAGLLMPIQAFQGAVVSYFLDPARPRAASLVRLSALVMAVSVVLAGLAGLLGPWLLGLLRPDYVLSGRLLAALTLAAGVMGLLAVFGSAALAVGRHGAYAAGWLTAAGVAWVTLLVTWHLLGLGLEVCSVGALVVGPAAGMVVHVVAVRQALAHRPPVRPEG
ncbi:MAG: hypothetical protein FWF02_12590 [Micrococcales bacterium]|nr:hypothetical protein [Micrococcales bacterium]MCL2668515.1 hypothetical protein [Micrococcales bacterium]